jgi:hypothetical protein
MKRGQYEHLHPMPHALANIAKAVVRKANPGSKVKSGQAGAARGDTPTKQPRALHG